MATGDALLALLVPGPRHGYDLKRAHDEWFAGLRPLAFGQVYSTLGRLQRDGLVEVAHTETADGPERVVYDLTASGRKRALTWLAEPIDPNVPGGAPSDELIRKTLAAYRLHADPNGLMARQRTAHLRAIRALEPAGAAGTGAGEVSGSPAGLGLAVSLDHQRLHLDADLRWLELAGERLRRRPAPAVDALLGVIPAHVGVMAEPDAAGPDAGSDRESEARTEALTEALPEDTTEDTTRNLAGAPTGSHRPADEAHEGAHEGAQP